MTTEIKRITCENNASKHYIKKELNEIKELVTALKEENKQLQKDIELRKEQNNKIMKLYNKMKSLYNDALNKIKDNNIRFKKSNEIIRGLGDQVN